MIHGTEHGIWELDFRFALLSVNIEIWKGQCEKDSVKRHKRRLFHTFIKTQSYEARHIDNWTYSCLKFYS